ncbi:MAG: hypothetical protein JW990_18655 [Thermoleophilia bacterium]|nr:hypothetical protein [Thermoleophilia bacterium]
MKAAEPFVPLMIDLCVRQAARAESPLDGGFYLRNGAVLDDAKAENLKAMIETGRDWRGQPRTGARR